MSSIYGILNYPDNYLDTNMVAGNCHAKFNWGAVSPYLGKWKVTGGPLITQSLSGLEKTRFLQSF